MPAVVFIAHFLNLDTSPIFVSIIFIRTLNAPFGVLLNEGIALSKAKHENLNIKSSFYLIITSQLLVLFCVEILLKDSLKNTLSDDFLLIFSCLIGSFLSYWTSYRIYKLVVDGAVGKRALSIISISPGVSTLLIYSLYFFIGKSYEKVLFLSLFLPAVIQLIFTYFLSRFRRGFFSGFLSSIDKSGNEVTVRVKDVFIILGYIAVLSMLMGHYRNELIRNDIQFAAIVLTLVNAITSFFNLFIKYTFLTTRKMEEKNINLLIFMIALLILANILFANFFLLVITLTLISAAALIKIDNFRILIIGKY